MTCPRPILIVTNSRGLTVPDSRSVSGAVRQVPEKGSTIMATLPPHFFVWLLYMHMSGQATPIAGFKTEAMCVQIRDGMSAKANSTVKFKCDKFAIER